MRSKLIERITALAVEAADGGEVDIARVLFALSIAIAEQTDADLARYIVALTQLRPGAGIRASAA